MPGVHPADDPDRESGRGRTDGGTERPDDRLRTDGGTEDEDAVAEIKQMLSEGDDGDIADAVTGDETEDEDEDSPAMDFGLKVGVPLALVAFGLLFVGPEPLLQLTPGDVVFVDSTDTKGPGNIWYISGGTLVLSLLAGVVYPSIAEDVDEDFKMDLGLGISLPTIGLMGLLVLAILFWPVVYNLLGGALVQAGIMLVVAVVALGIAVAGSIVTLVVAAIATLYFVGPALVGSYVGGFVGELVAT